MRTQTKEYLRSGFGSLISNQCAIDAAKGFPWWASIIVFLIGTFLPVIPITVSTSSVNGRDFVSGTNYSFDRDATGIAIELKQKGYEFTVNGNHELIFNQENETRDANLPLATYIYKKDDTRPQYDMNLFYVNGTTEEAVRFYEAKIEEKYEINTLNPCTDIEKQRYVPHIVILYRDGLLTALFKKNTCDAATSFQGDWKGAKEGYALVETMLKGIDTNVVTSIEKATVINIATCLTNWEEIYDVSYSDTKTRTVVMSTFIYWGVYAGLALLVGLLMFLITRGKRNFNNYLKWYQCMFISSWCTFSPGLLAMILGFLLRQYAMMFFIIFMGIRAMWISMKQLSATYQR